MLKYCISGLFSLFSILLCFSQTESSFIPLSIKNKLKPISSYINLPLFDAQKVIYDTQIRIKSGIKDNRFAKGFPVDLHPFNSGTWENTADGNVWRLGINSTGAYSLYLVLNDFYLLPNVNLFVYNSDMTEAWGPITDKDNPESKIYPVAPLSGNSIIIEINVMSDSKDFGTIKISEVFHDYKNEFGNSKSKSFPSENSGSCNVDINCPLGSDWQLEKYAVCKLIANGELCTGTLVNNTKDEDIPYLLTAYHCIENATIASGAVFYFDYERLDCGSAYLKSAITINGSALISTTPNELDFTVVKLPKFPSLTKVFQAGWDARNIEPAGGVCIHHPMGDVKKISADNDSLITANFGEGFNVNSHWLVKLWDVGTTEGGSSGAPFFNKNHQIIGTLTGGDANCDSSVNDYFSKFNLAWNYYTDSIKHIKTWLDQDNTGELTINGRIPFGYSETNTDTLWNISTSDTFTLSNQGLPWGYLSGHNSDGYTQFAEKFTIEDTIEVPGIILKIAKKYSDNIFSNITIKIWDGTDTPFNEIYSKPIYLKDLENIPSNYIEFDSIITLKNNFFIGYSINYSTPTDTFALYHAANRLTGLSTMFVYKNSWSNLSSVTAPAYHTSLGIGIISCKNLKHYKIGIPEKTITEKIKFYPNPAITYLYIEYPENDKFNSFFCFDMTGKIFIVPHEINNNKIRLNISGIKPGVYGFVIFLKNKIYKNKFIVINYL